MVIRFPPSFYPETDVYTRMMARACGNRLIDGLSRILTFQVPMISFSLF